MRFAEPNFLDVRARSHAFEGVAQYNGELTTVTGAGEPVRAQAFAVSADFFQVLGTQPTIGRTFLVDESKPGGAPVAVIGYGFWQRQFGGRSDLTGMKLTVMDQSVSVVGVMPAAFAFPPDAEIWVPREFFPQETARSAHNWSVVARLRSTVEIQTASTELTAIWKQLKQEYGKDVDAANFTIVSQQEYMVGNVRRPLMMILIAVAFLLTVACANVANLILAKINDRQREFAVVAALDTY